MTYVLLIYVKSEVEKIVGKLGKLRFEAGYYAYVGSAKLNFKQRIKRHFSKEKRLFWHIDYLLIERDVVIKAVFFTRKAIEHKIAKKFCEFGFDVMKRFGSSDCSCPGHLFRVLDKNVFEKKMGEIGFLSLQRFLKSN